MKIIKTKVIGDTITPIEQGYVIENQVNQYAIEFDFDETWNFQEKYCIFQDEFEEQTFKRPILANQVIVPGELLNGRITIQIYGQNIEDDVITNRQPSLKYVFSILNSLPTNANEEEDTPTPTQWELYIEQIEGIVDNMCEQFQEIKAQVELNTEDIGNLQTDVGNLQDRATHDEELIETNRQNISTNATEISNIKRDYSLITETGNKLSISIDSNYIMTITLKDKNNNILSSASVDFPIESAIVNASYNNSTKEITFTLQNGNTLVVPIGDIISGLASQSDLEALANRVQTIENDYLTSADKTELQQSITDLDNEIELEQQAQDNNILALQNENERLSRIVSGLPTKSANGTSFVLNDVVKANIKDYELRGNTSQATTTGKNLFNTNKPVDNFYYDASGNQTTGFERYYINQTYNLENVKLAFSFSRRIGDSYIRVCEYDSTDTFIRRTLISVNGNTLQLDSNTKKVIFCVDKTGDTYYFENLQIEVGNSATSYEEYTGGIPSPNPSYPQTINVATGNQEIKFYGKNLVECLPGTSDLNGISVSKNSNGGIIINGTPNATWSNICSWQNINIPNGTYTFSIPSTKTYRVCIRISGGDSYTDHRINAGSKSINIDFNNITRIRVYLEGLTQGQSINDIIYCQLESGSTATSYEQYSSSSLPISLGTIELNKIGTYQDRIYKSNGKWYLEKNIGKIVLNGTTNSFNIYNHYNDFERVGIIASNLKMSAWSIVQNQDYIYCDKLSNTGSISNPQVNTILSWNGENRIFMFFPPNTFSSLVEANTYLTTHNTTIYYVYITPITTEITDTSLISQLEDIYNIILNENNTIIVNGNLPTDTLVIGYADIQKLIDSLNQNRSVEENTRKGGETEPIEEPIEPKEEER